MRCAAIASAVALAACSAASPELGPQRARSADLVAASRAMTAIDGADARGGLAAERARRSADALARPDDAVARFLAAYAMPRNEEAWAVFRSLADDRPDEPWGRIGIARIYLAWSTFDQVGAEVEEALRIAPGNWIAVLLRAQADERRDHVAEARADYAAVLRADPENPEAHLGVARILRRAGDLQGARREAQAALRSAPDHPAALALLAALALDLGGRDEAASLLGRAAAASAGDFDAHVRLAKLMAETGNAAGAVAQWRAAVAVREDPAALRARADAARAAEDADAEAFAVGRLVAVEPQSAESWRRLGEIKIAVRDLEGAQVALEKALERDRADAAAHLWLGRVLATRDDRVRALGELRAAGAAGSADRAMLERELNVERVARDDVQAVQRAVGALIDRTYRARIRESPALSGALALRVTVDGRGAASAVEVIEDTLHDDVLRASAYWNLKDAGYPKKPGRYAFRFAFRPPR